jgi:peptidoglycan/xylan/chitin deacetylase (PgdA/CDA1 family)
MQANNPHGFWPGDARLVISISMQMEAGAQPDSGAESPLPKIDPKYPDIAATKWYEYGFKEGLPRLLDMFDRRNVKVTSHMVGAAVEKHPTLAKEIVQRGHEPSGHGQTWTPQYSMRPEQERKSYADSAGYNADAPDPAGAWLHLLHRRCQPRRAVPSERSRQALRRGALHASYERHC